jgi:ABC-type dipeptide/oligopeptide/nickel transport system permease subunit
MSSQIQASTPLELLATPQTGFARRARRSPTLLAGAALTGLILLAAILAPVLSPYDPNQQDLNHILGGYSSRHLLGTD